MSVAQVGLAQLICLAMCMSGQIHSFASIPILPMMDERIPQIPLVTVSLEVDLGILGCRLSRPAYVSHKHRMLLTEGTGFRCARSFSINDVPSEDVLNSLRLPTVTPTLTILQVHTLKGANLRSGPGSNYPIIGSARIDDYLILIAKAIVGSETWYLVRDFNNQLMWISGQVAEVQPNGETVPLAATVPPPP